MVKSSRDLGSLVKVNLSVSKRKQDWYLDWVTVEQGWNNRRWVVRSGDQQNRKGRRWCSRGGCGAGEGGGGD